MSMKEIAEKIKNADAILIGASNGLSITEGLHLFANNDTFKELFGDLQEKYGIYSILQGMAYRWNTDEEKWGFWSRLIHHYCLEYKPTKVMKDLKAIVGDKDYFIITSNGECHFEMSGFSYEKIYEIEGNWLTMQCATPCHDTVYSNVDIMEKMWKEEKGGKIPSELVPRCPHCGGAMNIHMKFDYRFIRDVGAINRCNEFLNNCSGKNLVVIELGIGWRNQLIKAPLMRIVAKEDNATYITVNLGEVYITDDIKDKSFGIDGYISDMLDKVRKEMGI